jgi:hypothetical protein
MQRLKSSRANCAIRSKVLASHSRYESFLDYGDEQDFHRKLEEFRTSLAEEEVEQAASNAAKP